jgi:hypothetical protein
VICINIDETKNEETLDQEINQWMKEIFSLLRFQVPAYLILNNGIKRKDINELLDNICQKNNSIIGYNVIQANNNDNSNTYFLDSITKYVYWRKNNEFQPIVHSSNVEYTGIVFYRILIFTSLSFICLFFTSLSHLLILSIFSQIM